MDASVKERLSKLEADGCVPSADGFGTVTREFTYIWAWLKMTSDDGKRFELTPELAHFVLDKISWENGFSTMLAGRYTEAANDIESA